MSPLAAEGLTGRRGWSLPVGPPSPSAPCTSGASGQLSDSWGDAPPTHHLAQRHGGVRVEVGAEGTDTGTAKGLCTGHAGAHTPAPSAAPSASIYGATPTRWKPATLPGSAVINDHTPGSLDNTLIPTALGAGHRPGVPAGGWQMLFPVPPAPGGSTRPLACGRIAPISASVVTWPPLRSRAGPLLSDNYRTPTISTEPQGQALISRPPAVR